MSKPVNIVNIGGVYVDKNQIADTSTIKKNDTTYYVINFKNGGKIEYPHQAEKNNSRIFTTEQTKQSKSTGEKYLTDETIITNIWGATFTGSDREDKIDLNGCTSCTVDVQGDERKDFVTINKSSDHSSYNNVVYMGPEDKVLDSPTNIIEGEGTHKQGDSERKLK